MGVRFPAATSPLPVVGGTILTTTEFACMTVGPFSPPIDGALIFLFWHLIITLGTGTTGLVLRIRRGIGITGQLVQATTQTLTQTASTVVNIVGNYADSPGIVAGLSYSATVVQVGATGNGTFGDGSLLALSL